MTGWGMDASDRTEITSEEGTNTFYEAYGKNGCCGGTADDVRLASSVFLVIGIIVSVFELAGHLRRSKKAIGSSRCLGISRVGFITLLVVLLEVRQTCCGNYPEDGLSTRPAGASSCSVLGVSVKASTLNLERLPPLQDIPQIAINVICKQPLLLCLAKCSNGHCRPFPCVMNAIR